MLDIEFVILFFIFPLFSSSLFSFSCFPVDYFNISYRVSLISSSLRHFLKRYMFWMTLVVLNITGVLKNIM